MKKPKWLGRLSGEKAISSVSKSEKLKTVRRQTDQKMRQQEAEKVRKDDSAKKE